MLQIAVVDSNAEERIATLQWLQRAFDSQIEGIEYTPRVNFRPVSISELKFQGLPDILVVGPAIAAGPTDDISHIRRSLPNVPVVVVAKNPQIPFSTVEYLSRIGIEEILTLDTEAHEIIRRFVMLSSRVRRLTEGRLIVVEASKGGVGATSLVAALGELVSESSRKVVVVDLDDESQSLSRFLQARPFLNEPLQGMLEGGRPVSSDFVEQCLVRVWTDLPNFYCMPPTAEGVLTQRLNSQTARIFVSILETLDTIAEVVIVDASRANGTLRRILHRAADTVLFVTENDPASVYSSFEKIKRIREELSANAQLKILLTHCHAKSGGLSRRDLIGEFERIVGTTSSDWLAATIPFCPSSARWPGSGLTLFSAGSRAMQKACLALRDEVLGIKSADRSFAGYLSERVKSVCGYLSSLARLGAVKNQTACLQPSTVFEGSESVRITNQALDIKKIAWQIQDASERVIVDNYLSPPESV